MIYKDLLKEILLTVQIPEEEVLALINAEKGEKINFKEFLTQHLEGTLKKWTSNVLGFFRIKGAVIGVE